MMYQGNEIITPQNLIGEITYLIKSNAWFVKHAWRLVSLHRAVADLDCPAMIYKY